jgi:hypothetical protein
MVSNGSGGDHPVSPVASWAAAETMAARKTLQSMWRIAPEAWKKAVFH